MALSGSAVLCAPLLRPSSAPAGVLVLRGGGRQPHSAPLYLN